MIALGADPQDGVRRYPVTADIPVQTFPVHRNLLMRRERRQLVEWHVSFPPDRRERVFQQRLQYILENAFTVSAVGHDDQCGFLLLERHRIISPAIVMALHLAIRRPVKAPCQSIAQTDAFALGCEPNDARLPNERYDSRTRTECNNSCPQFSVDTRFLL